MKTTENPRKVGCNTTRRGLGSTGLASPAHVGAQRREIREILRRQTYDAEPDVGRPRDPVERGAGYGAGPAKVQCVPNLIMGNDMAPAAAGHLAGRTDPGRSPGSESVHRVRLSEQAGRVRLRRKQAEPYRYGEAILKDVAVEIDPRRELFFEAELLRRVRKEISGAKVPASWGPKLMWRSNFRPDVYDEILRRRPRPSVATIGVAFIRGATLKDSYLKFVVVSASTRMPAEAKEESPYVSGRKEPEPGGPKTLEEENEKKRTTEVSKEITGEYRFDIPVFPKRPVPVGTYALAWVEGTASIRISSPEATNRVVAGLSGVEYQRKLSESFKIHAGPTKLSASLAGNLLGEPVSAEAGLQGGRNVYAPIFLEVRWDPIEHALFVVDGITISGKLRMVAKISFGPSPGLLPFIGRAVPMVGGFVLLVMLPSILSGASEKGKAWARNSSVRLGYAWGVAAEAAGTEPGEWRGYVEAHQFTMGSANDSFRKGWAFVQERLDRLRERGQLKDFCEALKISYSTKDVDEIADSVFRQIGGLSKGAYRLPELWQLVVEK